MAAQTSSIPLRIRENGLVREAPHIPFRKALLTFLTRRAAVGSCPIIFRSTASSPALSARRSAKRAGRPQLGHAFIRLRRIGQPGT